MHKDIMKKYIGCYIYMKTEDGHREYDFIIVQASNATDAKLKIYKKILKVNWMAQVLTIKLLSEVLDKINYFIKE